MRRNIRFFNVVLRSEADIYYNPTRKLAGRAGSDRSDNWQLPSQLNGWWLVGCRLKMHWRVALDTQAADTEPAWLVWLASS